MPGYDDLTSSEKALLDNFINNQRGFANETQKTMNHCASILDAKAPVAAILDTLADTDVIPNKSGLAGATDLTVAEVEANILSMEAALTNFNTDAQRQSRAKFAGINVTSD